MYFEQGTSLQTKLPRIGWTSVKWCFPIEKHFLLIILISLGLFCSKAPRCPAPAPAPLYRMVMEAQSSRGDYFFNKRKHWKGKCLKAVVVQREMTKWLLGFKTKQNTTATFFIFVRKAVQGGAVDCVEAKENRNQRRGEKGG